MPPPSNESAQTRNEPEICPLCFGCGMEVVAGKGARTCICAVKKSIRQHIPSALAAIPKIYEGIALDNIAPNAERHPKQPAEFQKAIKNPNANFAICGTFGCGKTHLLWAMYRTQLENRRVFGGTLEDLISEHKARMDAAKNGEGVPALSIQPEQLRQKHTKWSLFIDDIDKETPTEFVCKILFALVDAAVSFEHQIVFTTNLTPAGLIKHFEKADPRFGGAISRRLMDNAKIIKMF